MSGPNDKTPTNHPLSDRGSGGSERFQGEREAADWAELSRIYRGSAQDEPSPGLDNQIRAAARRAVNARPQPIGKSWVRRWTGPVATAAVVVLSVSMGLQYVDEKPHMVPIPVQQAMKPRTAVSVDVEERAFEDERQALNDSSTAKRKAVEGDASSRNSTMIAGVEERVGTPRPAEKKARQSRGADEPAPFVADPVQKQALNQPHLASSPTLAKEAAEMGDLRIAPKAADAAASGAPPVAASSASADKAISPAAPSIAASHALARSEVKVETPAEAESPEAWLRRILALQREGKSKEADEELTKFKRRYPDDPLPEQFKSLR